MSDATSIAALPIVRIKEVAARLVSHDWPFIREHQDAIAAHWAALVADKPAMFNGRVLLQCRGEVVGDRFEADYFELDYASFIAWTRFGFPQGPGTPVRNGFAMGALRSRDGAYLMGEMGAHTANAGKVYFAAGTPDPSDVLADGRVDLAGSVMRELEEETGLAAHEVTVGDGWQAVIGTERIAFMRDVSIDLPASEARALIRDRIARQDRPELSDIVIARSVADIDASRMPLFMQVYLRDALTREPERTP